jgi:uncharacterized glyoxalase superfamily protein PhnB
MLCGMHAIPFIRYTDAHAAMRFLVDAIGFEPLLVIPGEGDVITHAELRLGDGVIMIGSITPDRRAAGMRSAKELAGSAQGIYIQVDDADAAYARATAAGAEIVEPLRDDLGSGRGFILRDPDGNVWGFGTYLPGAAKP